jgi:hypothetical protein
MPRLLDTRIIGYDIADVKTRSYDQVQEGYVLKVSADVQSMEVAELGVVEAARYASQAGESDGSQEGITFQQFLVSNWVDVTPLNGIDPLFSTVASVAYGRGRFVAVGYFDGGNTLPATPIITYSVMNETGGGFDTWTQVSNPPFAANTRLWGVRYVQDRFVAFGTGGQWATSVDGISWTARTPLGPATTQLFGLAWAPGKGYVFVGVTSAWPTTTGAGVAFFSRDLTSWQTVSPPLGLRPNSQPVPIYGVAYGDGKFVAVGGELLLANENHIAYSEDGINWTVTPTSQPLSAHYSVLYGGGRWLVGGNDGGASLVPPAPYGTTIQSSYNGINYFSVGATQGNIQGIAYGNGTWVFGASGGGVLWYTTDGVYFKQATVPETWPGSPPGSPLGVASGTPGAYGNGLFVMGSRGGRIIRSRLGTEVFGGGSGGGGGGGSVGPTGPAGAAGSVGPTGPAGAGGGVAVYTGTDPCNVEYPVGSYLAAFTGAGTSPVSAGLNQLVTLWTCNTGVASPVVTYFVGGAAQINGTWAVRGITSIRSYSDPGEGGSQLFETWVLVQRIA